MRALGAIGLTLALFVLIYAPTSALAIVFRLQPASAVPFVMIGTLVTAALLLRVLSRRSRVGLSQYGIGVPTIKEVGLAVIVSAPIAMITAVLLTRVHEAGPLGGLSLSLGLVVLYFVVGAPIQEEVIFRGLLQTTLERHAAPRGVHSPAYGVLASLMVALLFGCIHLVVGPYTAVAALVLGLVAGELRRRSGSLLPAVICHALFNLGGIIWK